ncbi:putative 3-oxoacyl- reductase [Pseudomonas amygdali pv. hibisci]|uniref:3-oxoacyl-reductase n=4 Tax=Pseudomonas syringae group genomosp. 2 TaxID=251698 RepID=A0AAX1VVE1_PSEAJ|nr:putative 3-oxoacyl- reductase [Pseudomonas amygdali]KPX51749.1 putative 3-oxoacyl- reductase [Pseudomonas amygdali pv. hibisci]KPX72650.1 putative 3-oxoacyl- reductase [Pseudomonas amygdali pv. lachrymans]KPX78820.1 putative 3-oxoacyl- reductase [Pseudomonas amygdali pv. mellea]KPY62821.1 putative 3-oxoacyl- reductase [Pseudomonas amygdali pv. sesami]RML81415.1 putative 3-oxoacyl- reductase [Pseudomonas amygdali pv. tabaci]
MNFFQHPVIFAALLRTGTGNTLKSSITRIEPNNNNQR